MPYLMFISSQLIGAVLLAKRCFSFVFFSLRGWGALKISHPIFLIEAVWFFSLGLFPVAVGMGQVRFFPLNYVGLDGMGWVSMLNLNSMGYIG
jgi:hypothetical protein